jgi:hypothetical protein
MVWALLFVRICVVPSSSSARSTLSPHLTWVTSGNLSSLTVSSAQSVTYATTFTRAPRWRGAGLYSSWRADASCCSCVAAFHAAYCVNDHSSRITLGGSGNRHPSLFRAANSSPIGATIVEHLSRPQCIGIVLLATMGSRKSVSVLQPG